MGRATPTKGIMSEPLHLTEKEREWDFKWDGPRVRQWFLDRGLTVAEFGKMYHGLLREGCKTLGDVEDRMHDDQFEGQDGAYVRGTRRGVGDEKRRRLRYIFGIPELCPRCKEELL